MFFCDVLTCEQDMFWGREWGVYGLVYKAGSSIYRNACDGDPGQHKFIFTILSLWLNMCAQTKTLYTIQTGVNQYQTVKL